MGHAFNSRSFEQLLGDLERLAARAREDEQRLTALVERMERDGAAAGGLVPDELAPASVPAGAAPLGPAMTIDLRSTIRGLCVAARDRREDVEAVLRRLIGDVARADGGRPRVLVVDDSADTLELVSSVLDAAGFETITATNGLEAVLVAHYARPAVVLMDLTMPVLDGVEAARLLKASAATRHLKVIAHTARPAFYEEPIKHLFAHVLPKPADPEAVVASIRQVGGGPDD